MITATAAARIDKTGRPDRKTTRDSGDAGGGNSREPQQTEKMTHAYCGFSCGFRQLYAPIGSDPGVPETFSMAGIRSQIMQNVPIPK